MASRGGSTKKNPRRLRRRGFRVLGLLALSDPRRRVRYYAYYDDRYGYDDATRCRGRGGGEVVSVGHVGIRLMLWLGLEL